MPLSWKTDKARNLQSLVLMLLICLSPSLGQNWSKGPGAAEFDFLRALDHGRAAGLAGAITSLAEGPDAIGYNPAGIASSQSNHEIALSGRYLFAGAATGNLAYTSDCFYGGRCGYSAGYVNYGFSEELDENGYATGRELMPYSVTPAFVWASEIHDRLKVGFATRAVAEYLDYPGAKTALGLAGEAGVLYQPNIRTIGFGASVTNVGRKVSPHFVGESTMGWLPASAKAGMHYYPRGKRLRVILHGELPWHTEPLFVLGGEFLQSEFLQFRAATRANVSDIKHYGSLLLGENNPISSGNELKLTAGMTVDIDRFKVDFASQYWRSLGFGHVITLRVGI